VSVCLGVVQKKCTRNVWSCVGLGRFLSIQVGVSVTDG
jgi:hypothetical protein